MCFPRVPQARRLNCSSTSRRSRRPLLASADENKRPRIFLQSAFSPSNKNERMTIDEPTILDGAEIDTQVLRGLVEKAPGCQRCFAMLAEDPTTSATELGAVIQEAWAAEWQPETTKGIGRNVRSWARECGLPTGRRSTAKSVRPGVAGPGQQVLVPDDEAG